MVSKYNLEFLNRNVGSFSMESLENEQQTLEKLKREIKQKKTRKKQEIDFEVDAVIRREINAKVTKLLLKHASNSSDAEITTLASKLAAISGN